MSRLKPFITERRLQARVRALGRAIQADYRNRDLVLVGILKGSFIFMADLARAIDLPLTCDFMRVSSYGSGTTSSGKIRMEFDLSHPIRGKDVLLVEDIVDTGWTLDHVLSELRKKKPSSLKLAALLHKPERERVKVPIDYLGFKIPDRFVVGYGLDFDGRYRNLRHLAVLDA
ncbi:MAG TPA: hypoxanthine phosphoribosyltransferase [Planctomycetota bacterium]|jgi:hypoxanthine phosphoribosyltransferase|nr:hypoxanthine phosphoribosyltransferase [Planctomycetota bacterium]